MGECPLVKVSRDGPLYGVKVKWPRRGPWARLMWFPRFAWHGPFGDRSARWSNAKGAQAFADLLNEAIRKTPHD